MVQLLLPEQLPNRTNDEIKWLFSNSSNIQQPPECLIQLTALKCNALAQFSLLCNTAKNSELNIAVYQGIASAPNPLIGVVCLALLLLCQCIWRSQGFIGQEQRDSIYREAVYRTLNHLVESIQMCGAVWCSGL